MTVTADADVELSAAIAHLRGGRLAEAETAGRAVLAPSEVEARVPALRLLAAVFGRTNRDAEAARVLAEAAAFDAEGGGRDPDCWNDWASRWSAPAGWGGQKRGHSGTSVDVPGCPLDVPFSSPLQQRLDAAGLEPPLPAAPRR
jgi:hypothetical protein